MVPIGRQAILEAARTGGRYLVESGATPRFRPGDLVRTASFNPPHHTRLPAYAKGKLGTVQLCRGSFVFPDSNAHGQGEDPQPLYSVRFEAADLWGLSPSTVDSVYLDLWDRYLAPAVR